MGWSCDPSHVCTLDAGMVDYLTSAIQGLFALLGAVVGSAVVAGFNVFWRRL
jgi:hypothetical protein